MVGGPSVWKAVLTRPTHPNLDEILIWIQVVIHYWIGIGVVWAGLSSMPPHSQPIHDAQGWAAKGQFRQKGNQGVL